MVIDYNGNKGFRLLGIYEALNKGELVSKASLAQQYNVAEKTIQRDIDDLRAYLADTHFDEAEVSIKYDKIRKGYYLVRFEREWFTNEEVLAICKILLESRAFNKSELDALLSKLLLQVVPSTRKVISDMIASEKHCYVPLKHGKDLLNPIWALSQSISLHVIICFQLGKASGRERWCSKL